MAVESMRDLYCHVLAESHDAERYTLLLLDELETGMGTSEARDRVRRYREATARHVDMLERCMELLGGSALRVQSAALHGLRADRQSFAALAPSPSALETYDVYALGRIADGAAAAFRTLAALAVACSQDDARRLFERATAEEEELAAWCAVNVPVLAAGASLQRSVVVA